VERVSFLIESSGARLTCLLNPQTLVVRRVAGLRPRPSAAGALAGAATGDDPLLHTGGGRTELDVDLLFDLGLAAPGTGVTDVRDLTWPLWSMAENALSDSGLATAPRVRFVWGKSWNVPAVVAAAAERLENFTPEGLARRSWLRLRLWRVGDGGPAIEDPLSGARPRHGAALALAGVPADGFAIRELAGGTAPGGGERLDAFLARNGVSPRHWKLVADLNGLDDPSRVPPATALRLPAPAFLGGER
jgi:hypothetical protein